MTVITALAVWYGYELVGSRARYFGLDASVLEYSTRDYVLRSASAVLGPLLYLLVCGIALLWLHSAVKWALRRPELTQHIRVAAASVTVAGVLLLIEGIRVVADGNVLANHQTLRPLVLAAGALSAWYGPWLYRRAGDGQATRGIHGQSRATGVLAAAVIVLSLFWSFSKAAERDGLEDSYLLALNRLKQLPRVVVYSPTALAITGPGIEVEAVAEPASEYRWRYSGLRLLVRSSGKYFLLPSEWGSRDDVTIVLRDSPELRFEFQEPERLQ